MGVVGRQRFGQGPKSIGARGVVQATDGKMVPHAVVTTGIVTAHSYSVHTHDGGRGRVVDFHQFHTFHVATVEFRRK